MRSTDAIGISERTVYLHSGSVAVSTKAEDLQRARVSALQMILQLPAEAANAATLDSLHLVILPPWV